MFQGNERMRHILMQISSFFFSEPVDDDYTADVYAYLDVDACLLSPSVDYSAI